MPPAFRLKSYVFVAALLPALVTCGGEPTGPDSRITAIYVNGAPVLRTGLQWKYSALARRDTTPLTGVVMQWTSSDTAVATVDVLGVVTARAPGQAVISAHAGGVTGSAPALTVTDWPVARVQLSPGFDSLPVGDSVQLIARTLDSVSRVLTGRAVAWRSSDTAKAVVGATGMVRVRAAGNVAITATSETQSGGAFLMGQMPVAAMLMPDTMTMKLADHFVLLPLLRDANGNQVSDRAVAWQSLDPAVLRIGLDSQLVPQRVGTARLVTTCCAGFADTTRVSVVDPVTAITLGGYVNVRQGRSVAESALVYDSRGLPLSVPVTWRAEDTTALSIVPGSNTHTAVLTARKAGTTAYWVSADTIRAKNFVIAAAAVARYAAQPDTIVLRGYQARQIHLTVQDSATRQIDVFFSAPGVSRDTGLVRFDSTNATVASRALAGSARIVARDSFEGVWYTDSTTALVEANSEPLLQWTSLPMWDAVPQWSTTAVQLAMLDSAGLAMSWPGDVTVATDDTSLTVSPSVFHGLNGPQTVTLLPHRAGTFVLAAHADTLVQKIFIIVYPPMTVGGVSGTSPATIAQGDSAALSGTVGGYPLAPVLWASSDTTIAAIHQGTELVGRSPGMAILTPSGVGMTGAPHSVTVTGGSLVVTSITPAKLIAGQPAAILGSGFSSGVAGSVVTIDTVRALVTAASATEIDIVPQASTCAPTHNAVMTIASGGGLLMDTVPFASGAQLSLTPGQEVRLSGAALACNELGLTESGVYDVTVTDSSRDPTAVTPVRMTGVLASPSPAPPRTELRASGPVASPMLDSLAGVAGRHRAILEASLAFARRAGSPLAMLRAARPARSTRDSIGPWVRFKIPAVWRPDFCSSYVGITARREYTGQHVTVFLDSTVSNQLTDSAAAALGPYFDADAWPTATTYFGNPLAMDSLLDGDGRVTVLLSPWINSLAAGFVVSCDFYPESAAPSSNLGETIYLPTLALPADWSGGLVSWWAWLNRSTMVHELKHVTAFAERMTRGLPFDEPWLEEGSAVLAEELWSRKIYGTAWKGNATYAQSVGCDMQLTPGCPYAMFNAFALEYAFADGYGAGTETHSPLGPTSDGDASFYGSAWSLLRYTIDHYASDEAAFTHALVQSSLTGTDFLEDRSGLQWQQLLDNFVLSGVTDGQAGVPPLLDQPTWNTASIWAGLSRDFPGSFPYPAPFIEPRVSDGGFDALINLHGGSVGMAKIYSSNAYVHSTAIRVGGPDTTAAPAGVTLRIIRLH